MSGGGAVATLYYWLPAQAKKRPTIEIYTCTVVLAQRRCEHDVFTGEEGESYWLSRTTQKLVHYTLSHQRALFFRCPT